MWCTAVHWLLRCDKVMCRVNVFFVQDGGVFEEMYDVNACGRC